MKNIYTGNYKLFLIVPAILFVVFGWLALNVDLGIDLAGGTLVSIQLDQDVSVEGLDAKITERFGIQEVTVSKISNPIGGTTGVIVRYSEVPIISQAAEFASLAQQAFSEGNEAEAIVQVNATLNILRDLVGVRDVSSDAKNAVNTAFEALADSRENFNNDFTSFLQTELGVTEFPAISFRSIGPALGDSFLEQAKGAVIMAFVLMTIVIFLFFRSLVPSVAIMLAAAFDILAALAGMTLFGFPLTLASISALLMLVGYSVDTDIMLTTRLLKRFDATIEERTYSAMTTGLTMTITTLSAVTVLFVMAFLTQMDVVMEISFVLLAGLVGDVISTWMMNAPMLLMYVEKGGRVR